MPKRFENKLFLGDFNLFSYDIKSDSIDMVLTSPPYDNLRDYNGYSFDLVETIRNLYRILKYGGVVCWVVNDSVIDGSESGNSFRQALMFIDNGFKLHDTMIFAKNNPMPNVNQKRYSQAFEYIFIFSKGKPKTFNPIMELSKYGGISDFGKVRTWTKSGELVDKKPKIISKHKKHSNIFYYTVGSLVSTEYKHPAVFPIRLAEDMINTWSNVGDVVLDPFGGSGTTSDVAERLNRHWIIGDISAEYCGIIDTRMKKLNSIYGIKRPSKTS